MKTGSAARRAAGPHNTPLSSVTTAAGRRKAGSPGARQLRSSKLSENSACKPSEARTSAPPPPPELPNAALGDAPAPS